MAQQEAMVQSILKAPTRAELIQSVLCCSQTHPSVAVKIMRDCGIHPNIQNQSDFNRTPLMYAIWVGDKQSIQELLDLGADPNKRDSFEDTPLRYAAVSWVMEDNKESISLSKEIMAILIEAGALINATNIWGQSALENAQFFKLHSIAQFLKSKGAH